MGRAPVDVVRACFEAWARGDIDGVVANYADDVEVDATRLGEGVHRGRSAVRDYYGEIVAAITLRPNDLKLTEADGTVTARLRWRAVGATSGVSGEADYAMVFKVREGLVRRVAFFPDAAELPPS